MQKQHGAAQDSAAVLWHNCWDRQILNWAPKCCWPKAFRLWPMTLQSRSPWSGHRRATTRSLFMFFVATCSLPRTWGQTVLSPKVFVGLVRVGLKVVAPAAEQRPSNHQWEGSWSWPCEFTLGPPMIEGETCCKVKIEQFEDKSWYSVTSAPIITCFTLQWPTQPLFRASYPHNSMVQRAVALLLN